MDCGPGTYIRSIARDCGELLKNETRISAHGHITKRERQRSGLLTMDGCFDVQKLKRDIQVRNIMALVEYIEFIIEKQHGQFRLISPDTCLLHLPSISLSREAATYWGKKRNIALEEKLEGPVRVYHAKQFLGLAVLIDRDLKVLYRWERSV